MKDHKEMTTNWDTFCLSIFVYNFTLQSHFKTWFVVDILRFQKQFNLDVFGFQIKLGRNHFGILWPGNCLGWSLSILLVTLEVDLHSTNWQGVSNALAYSDIKGYKIIGSNLAWMAFINKLECFQLMKDKEWYIKVKILIHFIFLLNGKYNTWNTFVCLSKFLPNRLFICLSVQQCVC
jgi:hypothetical protein